MQVSLAPTLPATVAARSLAPVAIDTYTVSFGLKLAVGAVTFIAASTARPSSTEAIEVVAAGAGAIVGAAGQDWFFKSRQRCRRPSTPPDG